jgi:hypothetical protein
MQPMVNFDPFVEEGRTSQRQIYPKKQKSGQLSRINYALSPTVHHASHGSMEKS